MDYSYYKNLCHEKLMNIIKRVTMSTIPESNVELYGFFYGCKHEFIFRIAFNLQELKKSLIVISNNLFHTCQKDLRSRSFT